MTEKDYNPEQKNVKAMKQQEKAAKQTAKAPVKTEKKGTESKTESKPETKGKVEEKKTEVKKTAPKKKKFDAVVSSPNAPLSTKVSAAICKFIVGKTIEKAIGDLEDVARKMKSVPMKGEIPHRKGPGKIASGAGRYPKNASEHFIKLLKSLVANTVVNELDDPVIVEAVANIGVRPYGRFGRQRRKRTHIKIVAKSKNRMEKDK